MFGFVTKAKHEAEVAALREEYRPPRFTPAPVQSGMIVQNTGRTRLQQGDWSVIQADGSRKPWSK